MKLSKEEKVILWACIFSPKRLAPKVVSKLEKAWFKSPQVKKIVDFILNYFRDYNRAPSIDVVQTEFSGDEDIQKILQVVENSQFSEEDFEWLENEVDKALRALALSRAILDAADKISKKEIETSEIENKFKEALSVTIKDDGIFRYSDVKVREELLKSSGGVFPTFYPTLDEMFNGGLDDPCLFVIQSRSHGGKTAFKLNLAARAALSGRKCVFFSLEMSERQIYQRLDAIVLGQSIRHIYRPEQLEGTVENLKELFSKNFGDILILRRGPRTATIQEIRGVLLELKRQGEDFDYIFIDYINLIKEKGDLYEKGVIVAEGLLDISSEFKRPVITSVQLQRSSYNKPIQEIDLDNVSESMGIGNTASVFIHLSKDMGSSLKSEISFKILKDRLGGFVGKIGRFYFNRFTLRIYDEMEENQFLEDLNKLRDLIGDQVGQIRNMGPTLDNLSEEQKREV